MATHSDEINEEYIGYAPYNFVALNEKVITIGEELPDRSLWHEDRHTGVIYCSLCTESPLYIGGSDAENVSFFHRGDPEQPVIPGSSLRGMLRSLVEIISFSKLQPITNKKLFYRDINDTVGYQSFFVKDSGVKTSGPLPAGTRVYSPLVKAGILRNAPQGGYRIELCDMARVDHDILSRDLGTPSRAAGGPFDKYRGRRFPKPAFQGIAVTVDVDPEADHPFPVQYRSNGKRRHGDLYLRFRKVTAISKNPTNPRSENGILVLTGFMQHKHLEFVFQPTGNYHADPDNLLEGIVEQLEDADQITEWQEKVFPKELNGRQTGRRRDGGLRNGEPIFYLEDSKGRLDFIGRAQLFRRPFGFPPSELRYESHKDNESVDMAEAIFGFVDKPRAEEKTKKWTSAGRVYVSDAVLADETEGSVWLDPDEPIFHARVLATPKPSAYAHYIVQEKPNVGNRTQLSNHRQQNAIIRGHKLYWHQTKTDGPNAIPFGLSDLKTTPNPNNPDQYPKVKPIRPGLSFVFDIHFENLTKAELGALLWSIALPAPKTSISRHKLGMGKPLGMGSVKLSIDSLQLLETDKRFGTFLATPAAKENEGAAEQVRLETGLVSTDWESLINSFTSWMEDRLGLPAKGFDKHERIQDLRKLLLWPGVTRTDYMNFEQHKGKLVLPNPQKVFNADRMKLPPKSDCPEKAASKSGDSTSETTVEARPDTELRPDTEIRVMITAVTRDGVLLKPIGLPEAYDEYTGFISAADLGQSRYTVDKPARVIIVEIDDDAGEIRCRPRPKS